MPPRSPRRAASRANKARVAQARERRCRGELPRRAHAQAMTATAINAMSMQPPSMIVCVNRAARFHKAISSATRFAINILHRSQIEISKGCGGEARGEDRFGNGAWGEESSVPILIDAQAHVVCAKEARLDYGSHTIFIGRVMLVGIHGEVDPLIYVDGKIHLSAAGCGSRVHTANGNRDHAPACDVTRGPRPRYKRTGRTMPCRCK